MISYIKASLLSFLIATCPRIGSADIITLAADEWCPHNCTPDSSAPGFMVEIAQQALNAYGHTVVYRILPWARAKMMAEHNQINGIICSTKAGDPSFIFPAQEQALARLGIYAKAGETWRYSGVASLNGRRLGLIKDYPYPGMLEYLSQHPDLVHAEYVYGESPLKLNIEKLLLGRIDTIIEESITMDYVLEQSSNRETIVKVGEGDSTPCYIAFSPANKKSSLYAQQLSEGMTRLRTSGQLEKIMAKYKLASW